MADHRRHRRHRALDVRRERGQHPRIDRAHDHVRVDGSRRGRDGDRTPVAHHDVGGLDLERDGHPAGRHPGGQRRGERRHPAGDRPRAEPLLQVGDQPGPRRDVPQARARPRRRGVPATCRSRSSLKVFFSRLCSISRLSNRSRHLAGEVGGVPRVLEVGPAQHLPVLAERVDVVDPEPAEPGPQLVDGAQLGRARVARQAEHGAVLEPVLAHEVERLDLQLPLDRATALAEQVADDRRQQRRRRPGVPLEAVRRDRRHRAAEGVQPLEDRDVVAELGQPDRRGEAAEPAAHDHHPRHVRSPRGRRARAPSARTRCRTTRRGAAGGQR